MKKICLTALVCVLVLICCCAQAQSYRLLEAGSTGDDVKAMKERLYDLGYYTTTKLTDKYTDAVCDVVAKFQRNNGLDETGKADAYTQAVMYSDAAVKADGTPMAADAVKPEEGAGGEGLYRDLKEGAYGDDVLALKKSMYKLKLYTSTDFNNQYNSAMTERIAKYQQEQGLEATGEADAALQELMFKTAPTPTPKPTKTPKPTSSPSVPVELPARDEEGYLADKDAEPFIHEDFDDGHWYYIDDELQIEICRYEDPNEPLVWYETQITCKDTVVWDAILATGARVPGHNFTDPLTLAEKADAILAITDDNYGYRWSRRTIDKVLKYEQGVIIRNGEVMADAKPSDVYYDFPPLDVLAYFPDGSIELFYCEEHDAQDYLDMGVLHTWAFGPILIKDGVVNERLYDKEAYVYTEYNVKEPRQALGYYGPGRYVIITAKGRSSDSDGVLIQWMVDRMQERGVSDAFNFDGGYTTVLYFNGQAVNKKKNVKRTGLREVSSVLGIGTFDDEE